MTMTFTGLQKKREKYLSKFKINIQKNSGISSMTLAHLINNNIKSFSKQLFKNSLQLLKFENIIILRKVNYIYVLSFFRGFGVLGRPGWLYSAAALKISPKLFS